MVRDAFRTATGVHAAAVIKGERKGARELADVIYSGVPASLVGRSQVIEISHMSGMSNVQYWLRAHGQPADEAVCRSVLERAKKGNRVLREDEILAMVQPAATGGES